MPVLSAFTEPFYTGATLSPEAPWVYQVALGGRALFIDPAQYRRRAVSQLRPQADTSEEVGEQSINPASQWRRSQADWSLGAGQEFLDAPEATRRRFRSSKGIDCWTRHQLSLLKATTNVRSSANTNLKLLAVNGYLYLADGSNLVHSTDGSTFTANSTTVAIEDITTDGANVYVARTGANAVMKASLGGTPAAFGSYQADVIAFANNRLLAARTTDLSELDASGVATTVHTLTYSGFSWAGITGAPNGIYAWATSGDRSIVYVLRNNESTGALLPGVVAMTLPDGETLNAMVHYGGFMLLGTSRGLRMAVIGTSGELTFGPVVEISGGVAALEPQGEFCWFSWTNYDASSTGLGRANLAELTATLVPAYASDLMAGTSASAVQGTVSGVATFSDRRFFAVSASGLWAESATTFVASGELHTGEIRYGLLDNKVFSSLHLRSDPLDGTIATRVLKEDGTTLDLATISDADTIDSGRLNVNNISAESIELRFTLSRDDAGTSAPVLRRWTLRALPNTDPVEEILLPVLLQTTVRLNHGLAEFVDTRGTFQYIQDLLATRRVVNYQEGDTTETVYVEGIELIGETWSDDRRFFEGILVVQLKTVN